MVQLEEIIKPRGVEVFKIKGFCDVEGVQAKPAGIISYDRNRIIGVEDGSYAIFYNGAYLGINITDGVGNFDSKAQEYLN